MKDELVSVADELPLPQAELDALLDHIYEYGTVAEGIDHRVRKLCEAYAREALAMMVRSEMASHRLDGDHNIESPFNACMHKGYCLSLKNAPPSRKPLTYAQIEKISAECDYLVTPLDIYFVRKIEAAHGITGGQE